MPLNAQAMKGASDGYRFGVRRRSEELMIHNALRRQNETHIRCDDSRGYECLCG